MLISCKVANGAQVSTATHIGSDVGCLGLVGIVTPADLTSTSMTIVASIDGTNGKVHTDYTGASPTITIAADRYISLDPALYCGMPYIALSLSAAEAAEREFFLVMREVS